ncbi:MAG: hypothetical protein B7Z47_05860 [Chthoniobacter sp. 12-60-6]|nr:MAG: hypothetical protein B7Z47_05860 [Chthoniobacter sp. 12-60-6]
MPAAMPYLSTMSAREAIINEIKLAPDALVQEAYDYILFLKGRRSHEHPSSGISSSLKPDFLARQQALFGSRKLPDSQEILDELRAERF